MRLVRRRSESGFPLPPARLRFRVAGRRGAASFLEVGRRCRDDLEAALSGVGRPLGSFERILDFGCGCGRTLAFLPDLGASVQGCDIDAQAIRWCARNLPFAEFRVNGPEPPAPYEDGAFDLVYAISVLTHLPEELGLRWLEDLRRMTSPGGIVVVTIHGRATWNKLTAEETETVERNGFLFRRDDSWSAIFPEWYQTSFHSPEYVRRRFGERFEILDIVEAGMNDKQDVVVMRRPSDDESARAVEASRGRTGGRRASRRATERTGHG